MLTTPITYISIDLSEQTLPLIFYLTTVIKYAKKA